MQEYKILIPVVRDSDRLPHGDYRWAQWEDALLARFGGFTYAGDASGVWKDDNGEIVRDVSRVYFVAGVPDRADESYLRQLLEFYCYRFDQQCIYLRFPNGKVELVPRA